MFHFPPLADRAVQKRSEFLLQPPRLISALFVIKDFCRTCRLCAFSLKDFFQPSAARAKREDLKRALERAPWRPKWIRGPQHLKPTVSDCFLAFVLRAAPLHCRVSRPRPGGVILPLLLSVCMGWAAAPAMLHHVLGVNQAHTQSTQHKHTALLLLLLPRRSVALKGTSADGTYRFGAFKTSFVYYRGSFARFNPLAFLIGR